MNQLIRRYHIEELYTKEKTKDICVEKNKAEIGISVESVYNPHIFFFFKENTIKLLITL